MSLYILCFIFFQPPSDTDRVARAKVKVKVSDRLES
jgi:hypothetical protein